MYAHKYTFITLVDLLRYSFGNLFIYLDRAEVVFSKKKFTECTPAYKFILHQNKNIRQKNNIKI